LIELGGPAGIMGGLALYDNHLFGSDHQVRLEGLYGSSDTFEGEASYDAPDVLGPGSGLRVEANVFSDPNDQFFVGGNASELGTDEASFLRDQFDVASTLTLRPAPRLLAKVSALYEHTDVRSRSPQADARLDDAGLAGLRTTDLLTGRVFAQVDLSRGAPRTHAGTEVLVQLDYTHDLDTDRFRYGRYVAEVRQYVPLYVLPRSRRLALRLRVEQVAPVFDGRAVPFYHLPRLGGTYALRGFRYARFRDDGSLLASAEYRYPIWRQFDAVVFVDAGQVFDGLGDVAADRFHWSYGGGLHMLNRTGIAFRFEVAYSVEGLRSILTVRPSFARWSR
jgi:outer membrane protein assembly factor BamA